MSPDQFTLIGIAIAVSTILGAWFAVHQLIKPFVMKFKSWATNWEQFMVDWSGEPAREGRDAVPGVMSRLNKIDGELSRNGGRSIKDTVNRIEKRLKEGDARFDELSERITKLEDKLSK